MRGLALFVIGLMFGGGLGFVLAASLGVTLDGHDHSDPSQHGSATHEQVAPEGHDHEAMELAQLPAEAAPEVSVTVTPDPVAGWLLHLETRNFRFAPAAAGHAHVPGEGHAHLYVNGEKLARLYGPWFHIAELPRGRVVIEVTLNANHHRPLGVAGQPIRAETIVEVD